VSGTLRRGRDEVQYDLAAASLDSSPSSTLSGNHVLRSNSSGTLGWTATHVDRNTVVTQLHLMPNSVLESLMSSHDDSDGGVLTSSTAGTGNRTLGSRASGR
jgi:hypothetical protein